MSQCEWNPRSGRPTLTGDEPHGEAVVSVGHDGMWHLCHACSLLPRFSRYRKRVNLSESKEPSDG